MPLTNDTGNMNVFILMGQSNMSGRGNPDDVETISSPDIFMWRDGRWVVAKEPLHTDKPRIAGVGLGMSFAAEVMKRTGMSPVGLVPCAVGGTPLNRWMPGEDRYEAGIRFLNLDEKAQEIVKVYVEIFKDLTE